MSGKFLKRKAVLLLAAATMLGWPHGGESQAPFCTIDRGEDLLDVLEISVKHNVFIGLDDSGTMDNKFDGSNVSLPDPKYPGITYKEDHPDTRLATAKRVLSDLVKDPDLNDASGTALVNWGFFYTKKQDDKVGNSGKLSCAVPQKDGDLNLELDSECEGLQADDMVLPGTCGQDTKKPVLDHLRLRKDGGIKNNGGTANARSLDQIAGVIGRDYRKKLKPGQRNFIIYVTDGFEDCACETTAVSFPGSGAFLKGGKPALRSSTSNPNTATAVGTNKEYMRGYNQGIIGQHALKMIDPTLKGTEGDIFVLLIGQDDADQIAVNTHWGWEASGVSLGRPVCPAGQGIGCARPGGFAGNDQAMKNALKDLILKFGVPPATVTLGTSIVGSVKEVIATHTDPNNPKVSPTALLAKGGDDVDARRLRAEYRNNVLFTTSVETPGFYGHLKAYNIYTLDSNGTRKEDYTEIWDAGLVLQERNLQKSPRNILFHRSVAIGTKAPPPLDFTPTVVTATDLGVGAGFLKDLDPTGQGAKTAQDAVELVVQVIHGWRLVIDSSNGFYKPDGKTLNLVQDANGKGTWKLFESTKSSPTLALNPPRSPEMDPPDPAGPYSTFFDKQVNRLSAVYLGANGGMLHAFRADNGHEIYAYISSDFLPKLQKLVRNVVGQSNGTINHEYFVASSPSVEDAYLKSSSTGEWRTVLTYGRGAGGKYWTALDVTDVGDWNGSSALQLPGNFQPPTLLFTVGNRDGVVDKDPVSGKDYDGMGETWSIPVMGRVETSNMEGQWVLFAGSGYGCTGSDEGRYFYVLKLEDGTIYYKSPKIGDVVGPTDPGVDQNALVATPTLYNPHRAEGNGDDYVRRTYIGDLQGFVHRLDCSNVDPKYWEFGVLFEVTEDAVKGLGPHNQPIATRIALLKLAGKDDIHLFFGTGGDNRVQLTEPSRFKLVGLVDPSTKGTNAPGQLLVTDDGGKFFYDLPKDERVTVAPITALNSSTSGVVFFASNRIQFDAAACANTFYSTLFAAGVTTGLGGFDLDPTTSGVQSALSLGPSKVAGLFHRENRLYISKSGAVGVASETQIEGDDFQPPVVSAAGQIQLAVQSFSYSRF